MEFGFTEEQLMFRDSVYKYAKKEIAPLAEEADLKSEFSMEVWRKLGEMGLLGLPFPEELGGSGANVVTCCLSGEALGHAGVDQDTCWRWERIRTCAWIPYTNMGRPLN